jgi:hypothetical protein
MCACLALSAASAMAADVAERLRMNSNFMRALSKISLSATEAFSAAMP